MTPVELETAYTAIANAIAEVGPEKTQLLLATLCLQLAGEASEAEPVMKAIHLATRLAKT